MNRFFFIFCFLLFCMPVFAFGTAYQEGRYADAREMLLHHLDTSLRDKGPVYYNLGNVYYQENDLPRAYWAYTQAARYLPRDRDVRHNLAHTQDRLGVEETLGLTAFFRQFPYLSFGECLVAVWFFLVMLGVVLWLGLFRRIPTLVLPIIFIGTVFFSGCALYRYLDFYKHALVVTSDAALRPGPIARLPAIQLLPAGTAVRILRTQKPWAEVRLKDGRVGWISDSDFLKL